MSGRAIHPAAQQYLDRIASIRPDDPFPDIVLSAVRLLQIVMPQFVRAEKEAKARGRKAIPGVSCEPFYMVVNLSMVPLESDGVAFGPMALVFFKDGKPWAVTSFIGDEPLAFCGEGFQQARALPQAELEAFGRKLEDELIAALDAEIERRKAAAKKGAH